MDKDLTSSVMIAFLRTVLFKHLLDLVEVLVHAHFTVVFVHEVLLFLILLSGNSHHFIIFVMFSLGATAESDARDSTEHNWQTDKGNVDENIRSFLLAGPELII